MQRFAMTFAATMVVLSAGQAQQARPAPTGPSLPAWDTRASCERSQRLLGMESASMVRLCVDNEDRAEETLKADWDAAPAAARRSCLRQQAVLKMTSYRMLVLCLDREVTDAAALDQRGARR